MSVPLPPLPAFGTDVAGRPAGRDVGAVLAGEHRRIAGLCAELAAATEPTAGVPEQRRRDLAAVVTATLSRHLSAEEQYLYPAVRAAVPDGDRLADREIAEDRALLRTLRELSATPPGDPEFGRLAGAVRAQVRRHATAADDELLPVLGELVGTEDLVRLGNRVETAEEAAPTRAHPATPATPPWNKMIDPAVGVVDKVRDVLSRRVTYPEDL